MLPPLVGRLTVLCNGDSMFKSKFLNPSLPPATERNHGGWQSNLFTLRAALRIAIAQSWNAEPTVSDEVVPSFLDSGTVAAKCGTVVNAVETTATATVAPDAPAAIPATTTSVSTLAVAEAAERPAESAIEASSSAPTNPQKRGEKTEKQRLSVPRRRPSSRKSASTKTPAKVSPEAKIPATNTSVREVAR